MTYVGLLCNCTREEDPVEQLSASLINRAFLMDELLAPSGIRVFAYSPLDITSLEAVPGYLVEGQRLVAATRPVPKVNANWTYATRRLLDKGMGYRPFKAWARENGVGVYVPYAFSELVSNKQKAYDAVSAYDPSLHPRTEAYRESRVQIESFVEAAELVFVKPRAGSKGNRIFVIRRSEGELSLDYYDTRARRSFPQTTVDAAKVLIDGAAGEERYVLQEGVESLRYQGAVFDVRVVMVSDGTEWHSILETRLAPPGSHLSNVFQGGSIQVSEDLFREMFGEEDARSVEQRLRDVSLGLASHFESLFPSQLMELGFDFVLDVDRGIHLVEVNAKPGVAGFGSEQKIFDWRPEDEPYYDKWVRPHVRHLAEFFRRKVEAAESPG